MATQNSVASTLSSTLMMIPQMILPMIQMLIPFAPFIGIGVVVYMAWGAIVGALRKIPVIGPALFGEEMTDEEKEDLEINGKTGYKMWESMTDEDLEKLRDGTEEGQNELHKACEACKSEYSGVGSFLTGRQTRFCNTGNSVCGNSQKLKAMVAAKQRKEAIGKVANKGKEVAKKVVGKVADLASPVVDKVKGRAKETFEDTSKLVSYEAAQAGALAKDTTQKAAKAVADAQLAAAKAAAKNAQRATSAVASRANNARKRVGRFFSDERLKKNIIHVGSSDAGVPIYQFEYLDELNKFGLFQGVLSRDVKHLGAVEEYMGFDVVNYDLIDVDFIQIF